MTNHASSTANDATDAGNDPTDAHTDPASVLKPAPQAAAVATDAADAEKPTLGGTDWRAILEAAPYLDMTEVAQADGGGSDTPRLKEPEIRASIEGIPTDLPPGDLDDLLAPIWDSIAALGPGLAWDALTHLIEDRFGMTRSVAIGARAAARRTVERERRTEEKENREPSDAEILVSLADGCELFHEPGHDGKTFADVPLGCGGRLTYGVRSRSFRTWLGSGFYGATGRGPSDDSMAIAVNTIDAKARHDGGENTAFVRVGWLDAGNPAARCFVDLGGDDGGAVEIDAAGWRVVTLPSVRFRRSEGMLPLPRPETGGRLGELFEVMNVRQEDRVLVLAWALMAFHWRGAYTILVFRGEQGSAKSSSAGALKRLIDPGRAGLRAAPKDPRDLMIAANSAWVLAFDNLSHIPPELSDALCRLATPGTGGMALRALYANDEEFIFEANRPIIINGIGDGLVGRSDLADRSIQVECPTIPEEGRRTDDEVKAQFAALHPRLMGALFDAVAIAIRNVGGVKLETKTRMADFEVWGCAAEPAFACAQGAFLEAYRANRASTHDVIIEHSPLAVAVIELVAKVGGNWQGTSTDLRRDLGELLDDAGRHALPKTPKALSDALRRLAPNLRAKGIEACQPPRSERRIWSIARVKLKTAPPTVGISASVASVATKASSGAPFRTDAGHLAASVAPLPASVNGIDGTASRERFAV